MVRVYISVGSNIERERQITSALDSLAETFGPLETSSVYESEAVGFDSAPFYNLVVGFDSDESPRGIQKILRELESVSGRTRTGQLAARTLDLDLLLYGDAVIEEPGLFLPRHDIERYAFVLGPLAEIAGPRKHPVTGVSFADMWSGFDDERQALTRINWPPGPVNP